MAIIIRPEGKMCTYLHAFSTWRRMCVSSCYVQASQLQAMHVPANHMRTRCSLFLSAISPPSPQLDLCALFVIAIIVGDWTFGSSPHPRKCSLTRLQSSNERNASIPEGDKWSLRSTNIKTKNFGVTKDITFRRPKVTNGHSEAQARRPRLSVNE